MFSKLDTSGDLFLDQTELAAINLDKYEVCIRPFFNSCDTYKDGRVSTAEWCFCFWRESKYCPWLSGTDFFLPVGLSSSSSLSFGVQEPLTCLGSEPSQLILLYPSRLLSLIRTQGRDLHMYNTCELANMYTYT